MSLGIKLFADGASLDEIKRWADDESIAGFTTNPSLLRAAGVKEYVEFARKFAAYVGPRPVSFEVLDDTPEGMLHEGRIISTWGPNVNVKIPIITTAGELLTDTIHTLSREGVPLNVTCVLTEEHLCAALEALRGGAPSFVSVFAGRIADTGRDPSAQVRRAVELARDAGNIQIIWASVREIYNIIEADRAGCHIITVTPPILERLSWIGRDLNDLALETVSTFVTDGRAAGLHVDQMTPAPSPSVSG